MKKLAVAAVLCLDCLFAIGLSAGNGQPIFTTFDVPGAGTGAGQGTVPYSINEAGTIAGQHSDAGSAIQGFVRTAGGAL
jgi:hypothetical protein